MRKIILTAFMLCFLVSCGPGSPKKDNSKAPDKNGKSNSEFYKYKIRINGGYYDYSNEITRDSISIFYINEDGVECESFYYNINQIQKIN